MDLQKAKIYLDKLNREFNRMTKDPDTIVRLDIDIMASYVRELYDAILSDDAHVHKQDGHHTKKSAVHKPVEPTVEPPPPPVAAPPKVITAAPPPPPVIQEVAPAPAPPPPPPPPVQEIPPAPPAPAPPPVTPAPVAKEPAAASGSGVESLFEEKQVKELSDKLSELPIADLKKAIALNDRLLLTSELFAGDGKAFESAITAINHLNSFDAAQEYLVEHCVVRYAWTDKKRLDTAKNFIRLVRRRFK